MVDKNVYNSESKIIKWGLIIVAIMFLIVMLGFPLVVIIVEALKKGLKAYMVAVTDPYTFKAIKLTHSN